MTIIDGKAVACKVKTEVRDRTDRMELQYGIRPGLAVVLIGEDPASQIYVRNKMKACEETGIRSFEHFLPESTKQEEAVALVRKLAQDETVHGILVQLPLPKHLNAEEILAQIPFEKDVDGFSAENVGRLSMKQEGTVACTPYGVMELLKHYRIPIEGKRAVVVGRSNIVGKPMAMLLINANATVTVCHSKTANLKEECARADILVAAIGKAKYIGADMVKEGAVVIDVGMNRDENGKLCGDVDFESVKEKVSYITPVPGGVGPMTIAMLMVNACNAAEKFIKRRKGIS